MEQPSKPAVYLRRLQRALSRPKSSKSKDVATSAAAPPSPSLPSFQHSNGRRLSLSQYIQHQQQQQGSYSVQLHSHHHHYQHNQDHHYDTPLYSLQRRRNVHSNNGNLMSSRQRSSSPGGSVYFHHPSAVDTAAFAKGSSSASSSKLVRRSGPPAIITIHHIQPDQHYPSNHSNGTYVTLARSKSMPLRRRKRFSHQPSPSHPFPPTPAMPSYCLVDSPVMTQQQRQPSQWSTCSSVPASPTTLSPPSANHVPELRAESIQDNIMSSGFAAAAAGQPDTTDAVLEQLVLDLDLCPFSKDPGSTVSDTMSDSQSTRQHSLDCNSSSMIVPGDLDGYQNNRTQTPSSPRSPFRVSSRPIRSLTSSSLVSNQSSTTTMTMTQVDSSSMSIQSHMSEASMLSAAMSASGLPSMDMMMDQVDKSIAADRRAQLVENAAVSVPHVTYVNRLSLMAEPCSAKVETWVN